MPLGGVALSARTERRLVRQLSPRLDDGFLVTPTNACLGFLDPAHLSKLDPAGNLVSGDPPTKEFPLHLAFYAARDGAGGVVHLHSSHATALSCLDASDIHNCVPALTPYMVMRVGEVALVPYVRPGSSAISEHIRALAPRHSALLLANHGPVVSAATFRDAVFAAEELEEAAKLVLLTRGLAARRLTSSEIDELRTAFSLR